MTGGRRFSLSSPDWGQDHLSLDAVVAYVDDELSTGAHARAETHLACCAECRAEVVAQRQARAVLRTAAGPRLPSSLLHTLRSIPVEAELPPPPPGLGITADGQFVLLRDVPRAAEAKGRRASASGERSRPGRRSSDAEAEDRRASPRSASEEHSRTGRRPFGAESAAHPDGLPPEGSGGAWRLSRRTRVGAVSGLALGALAVGALVAPGASAPAGPGVLGGTVLDVPAQARLSAAHLVPAVSPAVAGRSDPTLAKPAVADAPAGDAAAPGAAVTDTATPESTTPDTTTAAAVSSGAGRSSTAGTASDDSSAVLDAGLRARLDRVPVAFHRSP